MVDYFVLLEAVQMNLLWYLSIAHLIAGAYGWLHRGVFIDVIDGKRITAKRVACLLQMGVALAVNLSLGITIFGKSVDLVEITAKGETLGHWYLSTMLGLPISQTVYLLLYSVIMVAFCITWFKTKGKGTGWNVMLLGVASKCW